VPNVSGPEMEMLSPLHAASGYPDGPLSGIVPGPVLVKIITAFGPAQVGMGKCSRYCACVCKVILTACGLVLISKFNWI
jgi:hypothetical protein